MYGLFFYHEREMWDRETRLMVISESKEKLEQYCKEQLDTENEYTIINNDKYEEGYHYKSQGGKHEDGYLIAKLMKI